MTAELKWLFGFMYEYGEHVCILSPIHMNKIRLSNDVL